MLFLAMEYQNSNFKIGLSLFGLAEKYTEQSTHCAMTTTTTTTTKTTMTANTTKTTLTTVTTITTITTITAITTKIQIQIQIDNDLAISDLVTQLAITDKLRNLNHDIEDQ